MGPGGYGQQKMKILFLASDIIKTKGGIQVFNRYLLEALVDSGHTLSVISINDTDSPKHARYSFLPIAKSGFFRKSRFILNTLRESLTFKPDFILCGHINFSFLCSLVSAIFKIPYLTLTHGIEAWQPRGLKRLGLKKSYRIISVSAFTKEKILKSLAGYPKEHIAVLSNTFDPEKFIIQPKPEHLMRKFNITCEDKVLLTVARLSKSEQYKGYDTVIAVIKEISREIPNLKYIIVGSGDDEKRIVRLIKDFALEGKVILAGAVPHEEIQDYYSLCDLFIMPSSGEGFGIAFIEALACGKPAIAGKLDASPEALLDGSLGILVDPGNFGEIKEAVLNILKRQAPDRLYDSVYLRQSISDAYGMGKFRDSVRANFSESALSIQAKDRMHQECVLDIRPIKGWVAINIKEVWNYRELLVFIVWREVKIRYKQTVLGVAWAIIQPFMMMVVFSLFFGKFIKVPREGIPYPLFSYAAIMPWLLFSESITRCTASIIDETSLIKKVYFPRLIMPIANIISPLVDFGFSSLVFFGLMLYYGFMPTLKILLLPFFLLLALITALAVGLWLSAINVKYRDVRYVIPFLIQFWFFASPVVYSSTSLPASWQWIYGLNPMVGVIEGFRWVLLGTQPPAAAMFISFSWVLVILFFGAFYFRRMEKTFADVV
jgi:lipopolysaccharide transport system permease protein